jgi:predicted cupin superfamily sugar epimerase
MNTAEAVIKHLSLRPHPEGGYYLETYRCGETLEKSALPHRFGGERNVSTAIYYLLEKGNFSALHRIKSDEIFHFYLGFPVEILVISPDGKAHTAIIGNDIAAGQVPQFVVPKNSIQGLRVVPDGEFALLGATVAPGFDFLDFELIPSNGLAEQYPEVADLIVALSR